MSFDSNIETTQEKDTPKEKVDFVLMRRSITTPLIGRRVQELDLYLRDPHRDFYFVGYLQEVFGTWVHDVLYLKFFGIFFCVLVEFCILY